MFFYFITSIWGTPYWDVFLSFSLPSLLAEGNIPSLRNKEQSRYLLVGHPQEWERYKKHPIIDRLTQEIAVDFLEIHNNGEQENKYHKASRGYRILTDTAFKAKACGCFIIPDTAFSNGTVIALQKRVDEGKKLFLGSSFRFRQEDLLQKLDSEGLLNEGQPLQLSPRELLRYALEFPHAETESYRWETNHYSTTQPSAAIWSSPTGFRDGFIAHKHAIDPLLIDYSAMEQHDTSTLDPSIMGDISSMPDGAYVDSLNFPPEQIHYLTDSDELAYVSIAPKYMAVPVRRRNRNKERSLSLVHHGPRLNPLQRRFFRIPIFFHVKDLDDDWHALAQRTTAEMERVLSVKPAPLSLFECYCRRIDFTIRSSFESIVGERNFSSIPYWIWHTAAAILPLRRGTRKVWARVLDWIYLRKNKLKLLIQRLR